MQEDLNAVFIFLGILGLGAIIYSIYAIATLLARLDDIGQELFEIRKAILSLNELKEKE